MMPLSLALYRNKTILLILQEKTLLLTNLLTKGVEQMGAEENFINMLMGFFFLCNAVSFENVFHLPKIIARFASELAAKRVFPLVVPYWQ